MERCAVGEAAGGAIERLMNRRQAAHGLECGSEIGNCLPKKTFPGYPSAGDDAVPGHLPVTMIREPDLIMSVRGMLTALAAGVLVCGGAIPRRRRVRRRKARPKPAPPPNRAAKPAAAAAAVAGNAEPTLIGQFGTWGAYTATPNGKKVCFALAKPSSSKTNPPNRPRDPAYAFVSTRPAEKVTNEVSIMIGYALKPGSESTLEVGGALTRCTPRAMASGSRTPPRKSGWSRPCARLRTWSYGWEVRVKSSRR